MKKQRLYIFVSIGTLLALIVGGSILVWQKMVSQKGVQQQTEQASIIDTGSETSDRKTYRNEEYGFEVKIPSDWEIDIQSHNSGMTPIQGALSKDLIVNNKVNSVQFSFGPHETKAGGYVTGVYLESSSDRSVDDVINNEFSWENRERVFMQGQSAELLCWKSGCKQGETGIDKRFIFEKDGMIWNIFGGVSPEKGSKERVQEIEDFFASFSFVTTGN